MCIRDSHRTEHTRTSRGTLETHVKVALEGAGLVVTEGLGHGELTSGLLLAGVFLIKAQDAQGTAGDQETGRVSRGPVGQTVLNAVAGQLARAAPLRH